MSHLIQNNQVIKSVFHYTCVMTDETGLIKSTAIDCKEYEIADKGDFYIVIKDGLCNTHISTTDSSVTGTNILNKPDVQIYKGCTTFGNGAYFSFYSTRTYSNEQIIAMIQAEMIAKVTILDGLLDSIAITPAKLRVA